MRIVTKPIDFDLQKEGISQSLLGSWVKCRRLGRYLIEGWEMPLNKEAMAFGSLFHKLLEEAYGSIRNGTGVPTFKELALAWYQTNAARVGDMQMCEVMMAKAFALWEPYWQCWARDTSPDTRWVAAESQFDVRWRGFRLRGMRDGLFYNKNTLTLLESKTKSRIDGRSILLMLPMDWQNLFYLTASRAEGLQVRHVVYNILRRPALIQGKKESLQEYQERMRVSVEKEPESYFLRYEVSYSDATLQAFEQQLWKKLNTFQRWLNDPWDTYPNQGACVGLWDCEFLEACSSGDMIGYTRTRQLFRELE